MQPEITTWTAPPPSLSLRAGEVHVWRISLDQPTEEVRRFQETLEPHEIERSNRFVFDKLRRHFIVARGFVRQAIGRYLNLNPATLRFSYGPYGKPALSGDQPLNFNLSHSNEMALLAVASGADLGVDVESIRADFATEDIARRFFSRVENISLNGLETEEKVAGFFRCWTRKEAYIKAIGKGLSQALDGFDVTLGPHEAPALLRAEHDDVTRWQVMDLDVGAAYAAALIVEAPVTSVRCWQFGTEM